MRRGSVRIDAAEAGASVADLGTLVPIAAGLVLVNGVDAVAAFALAGLLFVAAGLAYGVPVPVQPIKAAAAIAIATRADPAVISAAGLVLGGVLLAVWATRTAPLLLRLFPKPLIRGNQLGVGVLLVVAAANLVRRPAGSDAAALAVAAAMAAVLALSARRRWPVGLALVAGGVIWTLVRDGAGTIALDPALPGLDLPSLAQMGTALTLLVIPQIPLTLSNAVVGTADLARDYYGARAARVTPAALCLTSGAANVAAGVLGGMPLCHGSSGMTAYHRLGARTGGVNLVAGGTLLAAGLLFGRTAPALFALIPAPVLGALLAYTGLRHALLVRDLRGRHLAVALLMGALGAAVRNLAWGLVLGLPLYWVLEIRARRGAGGAHARLRPAASVHEYGALDHLEEAMKITVVGAGKYGSTTVQRLAEMGVADEVVMTDIVEGLPQGLALDMMQSRPIEGFETRVVGTNSYDETAGSDVCVVTAGLPRKPGMSRMDLLEVNAKIVREVAAKFCPASPNAVVIVVTNPLDEMTFLFREASGFPHERVFGQAGMLDTARFKNFVAEEFGVSPLAVEAITLGSHGDTMVPVPSQVKVGGKPLTEIADAATIERLVQRTRDGGAEIVGLLKTGSAYYAPSSAAAAMVKAVVTDSKEVMPTCAWMTGQYGIEGVYVGVPASLGRGGVQQVVELPLTEGERSALSEAAEAVRKKCADLAQLKG